VLPANGATGVAIPVLLRSSAFSDPGTSHTQAGARWQVATANNFATSPPLVWDSGLRTGNPYSIGVPAGVLRGDTLYYWRVRHKDNAGAWSNWSSPTWFRTAPTLNARIAGLVKDGATNAAIAGAQIVITDLGTGTKRYETYTNLAGLYTLPIPSATSYSIEAEAVGYTPQTQELRFRLQSGRVYPMNFALNLDLAPPAPPTGLTATPGDQRVELNWNPNTENDIAGYNLYRTTGTLWVLINRALITGTHYQDLGLTNGTTYTYTVTAVDLLGNESDPSAARSAVPVIGPPEPVSGLRAKLLGYGLIALLWDPSPSANVRSYHVYSDNGAGTIDYAHDAANSPVPAAQLYWPSGALTIGRQYLFAVRVEDTRHIIEQNRTVVIAVTPTFEAAGNAKVYISSPNPGKRLRGNQVCVYARPVAGFETGLKAVHFEVFSEGLWRDMQTHSAVHNNPDDRDPYFLLWDVSSLADSTHTIRAVAIDVNGMADPNPMSIQVIVDNTSGGSGGSAPFGETLDGANTGLAIPQVDIEEGLTGSGEHQARARVYRNSINRLYVGNDTKNQVTTMTIPARALDRDTQVRVTLLNAKRYRTAMDLKLMAGQTSRTVECAVDEFTDAAVESGQTQFAVPVTITIPYRDMNNDGWVDGYAIPETQLTPVLIDAKGNQTNLTATLDRNRNCFAVQLSKTGTIGLVRKLSGIDKHVRIESVLPPPKPPRWDSTGFQFSSGAGSGASGAPPLPAGFGLAWNYVRMAKATAMFGDPYFWAEIENTTGTYTWWGPVSNPYKTPISTGPQGTGKTAGSAFLLPGYSEFGLFFKVGESGSPIPARPGLRFTGGGEVYCCINALKEDSTMTGAYGYQGWLNTTPPPPTRAHPAWLSAP